MDILNFSFWSWKSSRRDEGKEKTLLFTPQPPASSYDLGWVKYHLKFGEVYLFPFPLLASSMSHVYALSMGVTVIMFMLIASGVHGAWPWLEEPFESDGSPGKTSHTAAHDASRVSDRQLDGTHPQGSTAERHAWLPVKLEQAVGHLEQGEEKCQQCQWGWALGAGLPGRGWLLSLASGVSMDGSFWTLPDLGFLRECRDRIMSLWRALQL